MFCGTFESVMDKNGRLVIPAGMIPAVSDDITGENLVIREGMDDCLEIHTDAEILTEREHHEDLFVVKCDKKKRRIRIPRELLSSKSFYFEPNVVLKGKGSYIRIEPGPPFHR